MKKNDKKAFFKGFSSKILAKIAILDEKSKKNISKYH